MATLAERLNKAPQLGIGMMYSDPGMVEGIGNDWDWIWIDGQHGEFSYDDIMNAVRICELLDKPSVVRVPSHESGGISRALDTYADAVMVPVVETAEQARRIVEAAKFPPLGKRSFGGRRPIDRAGSVYCHQDNERALLVCQIENPLGLDNVEAIAAVEGVDVLFFGGDDFALNSGLRMDEDIPSDFYDEAWARIAKAAKDHGKFCGGVFATAEKLTKAISLGYRLIAGCCDIMLLREGSKAASDRLRNAGGQTGASFETKGTSTY